MIIIDTHTFFGKTRIRDSNGKYLDFKIEELRRIRKKVKKEANEDIKFLVIPASSEQNEGIPQIVRDNSDMILGAYAHVVLTPNPFTKVTTVKDIEYLALQKEIIGLKIVTTPFGMAIDNKRIYPFAELAGYYSLPFLIHCSNDPNNILTSIINKKNLAKRFPDTQFICAHLGAQGFTKKSIEDNINLALGYDNVSFNTSALSGEIKQVGYDGNNAFIKTNYTDIRFRNRAQDILMQMHSRIPGKIIFGSDAPYLEHSLHPLNNISREVMNKICYENVLQIFKRINYSITVPVKLFPSK